MKKTKPNQVERDLLEGLEGFLADLKSRKPLGKKYSIRRIVFNLQTRNYGPEEVKSLRAMLQVSQALFAQFLGVSANTVRSWEQGQAPSEIARRFMDEIHRNPAYWRKRIREVAELRAG